MFRINARDSVLRIAAACCLLVQTTASYAASKEKAEGKPPEKTIYDYSLVGFDGKEVPLSTFKDKVLVIVNLASQSIFKSQLEALETLQKTYKDKGLVVLGIPSNDFGALEPGTDAEIQKIYINNLHVDFPLFSRVSVRGKDQSPVYGFLTSNKKDKKDKTGGDVHWSYTKFIVDRAGKVVARFEPEVAPDSPELQATIENVLAGTLKPAKEEVESAKAKSDEDDDDSER
jgi:glutathione peroxidase